MMTVDQLGPAPEAFHFEPDLQKKIEKIGKLGWKRMRWADGFSLLHWGCKKNRFDLVRHLLERAPFKDDIEIDMADERGKVAVEYTRSDAIKEYLTYMKGKRYSQYHAGAAGGIGGGGGASSSPKEAVTGGSPSYQPQRTSEDPQATPLAPNVDKDAHRDVNILLLQFCEHLQHNDETVPHAVEELMDKFTNMIALKAHEKAAVLIREASKEEIPVVKNAIQNTPQLPNILIPDHAAYVPEIHATPSADDGTVKIADFGHKRASVSVDVYKNRSATIERIVQVNRHDKDLGLIIGLSGCHVIGFANERLIHDFELGDQIIAVNNQPVGCSMELCRAIFMGMVQAQGNPTNIAFGVKRGGDELLRKLLEDGYLVSDVRNFLANRRDLCVLASAALKCGLVNLPGGEESTFILGHCCEETLEGKNLLNGVCGNIREVKIEIEFLPGRPKSLGLELALGSTKIRRFALNAANCRYVGKHYFVANDLVVSVGGIKVCTESELKEAYSQARDHHDVISFVVKREVDNIQPEFDFTPAPPVVATAPTSAINPSSGMGFNNNKIPSQSGISTNNSTNNPPVGEQVGVAGSSSSANNNLPQQSQSEQPPIQSSSSRPPIDYGPNPYGVKTYLTIEEVKDTIPPEYKKALEKVEKRGWAATKWDRGYTLMHWAARSGNIELCRFLIAAVGAEPGSQDDRGLTPKDHASRKGHADVVHFLETECQA